MTLGQKLHLFRSKAGLSQEDVAGRLLVSRQTVSQWEKDQTMPTVDNLLRLRELFGVSLDELFSEEAPDHNEPQTRIERCSYTPTDEDYKRVRSMTLKPLYLQLARFIPVLVIVAAGAFFADRDLIGFFIGIFFCLLVFALSGLIRGIRAFSASVKKASGGTYTLELNGDELFLKTSREGAERNSFHIDRTKPLKVCYMGNIVAAMFDRNSFIIEKAALENAPAIKEIIERAAAADDSQKAGHSSSLVSRLLLFAAIVSPVIGLFLITRFRDLAFAQYALLLLLPLPIASLVFGIVKLKKGLGGKANVIVGAIVAGILVIYGCMFIGLNSQVKKAQTRAGEIGTLCGIDIPQKLNSALSYDADEDPNAESIHITTLIVPKGDPAYEKMFADDDERWLSVLPDELRDFIPVRYKQGDYDRWLMYNADTGEYNTVPAGGESNNMILLCANDRIRSLDIAEYRLKTRSE